MEKAKDVRPSHDDFEPIELGSVSEETKGDFADPVESATGSLNSHE